MGGLKPVLRPSKGIHVVFPRARLGLTTSTVIARGDRIIFAIPYGDCAYVGTTDTDYKGDPGDVVADADDVKYLVDAVNDQFDGVQVSPADIISSWAGVRPLVADEGSPTPSDVSRYAEETTAALAEKPGIPPAIAHRLLRAYGTEHSEVLAYATRDADLLHPLADGCPVLRAEALFAAEEEMALTLEDFMLRRTELMLFDHGHGLDAAEEAVRLMGGVLGWDGGERKRQVEQYKAAIARMTAFKA
jgi:glycerol-3-phosphate dehydrogenase